MAKVTMNEQVPGSEKLAWTEDRVELLKKLWNELSADLVARGVRAEGRAVGATSPVVW